MKTRNKLCLSLLATLSLVAGSASAASAHDEEEAPEPGAPMETDGWVPVAEDYYDDDVFTACGTMITVRSGDVREVEMKTSEKRDGRTVTKYRGDATVDVIAEPGGDLPYGGFIDELDISGTGSERVSADGSTIVFTLKAPSIIYPATEIDAAAFANAGLPEIAYFTDGKLVLEIVLSEDMNAVGPESVEVLKNKARGVVDLCQVLKESAVPAY
jgi:hypothetical protein